MPDEAPASRPEQSSDEPPAVSVPSHDPLPLPPEVQYTRPTLGRSSRPTGTQGLPSAGGTPGTDAGSSNGVAGHGAGLAAGTTFVVSIIAGAVAGNWMDAHWNHTGMPWATLIMTLLGAAAGFTNMQRILSRSDRNRK